MSKVSTVSLSTACPLEVTSAWLPSGETATPRGPPRPGPCVIVMSRPAGVRFHPEGVIGAPVAGDDAAAAAKTASSAPITPMRPSPSFIPFPATDLLTSRRAAQPQESYEETR